MRIALKLFDFLPILPDVVSQIFVDWLFVSQIGVTIIHLLGLAIMKCFLIQRVNLFLVCNLESGMLQLDFY